MSSKKAFVVLGFVAILGLIAKPVWEGRHQWLFGQGYDDGIYMATAKSLAMGEGYRQTNLPWRPVATKYPPLYPLYLAIAWKLEPRFPLTLKPASLLQDALLPVYLAVLLVVLRQLRLSWRRTFFVAAMTFVSITFVFLTIRLFSELLFGCFLLAAIGAIEAAVERNSGWWATFGGLLTGLAYLTRNAALPLLLAVPIFFLLRKRARLSAYFFAFPLPIAVGWYLWGSLHAIEGVKSPYLHEFMHWMALGGFGMHLMTQLSTLSAAVANDFFPGMTDMLHGIPLHHLVLVAAIAGGIRFGRRQQWPLAVIFTGLYLIMILCWWFHGMDRLMAPVLPILLLGITEEGKHFAGLCAHSIKNPRFKEAPRWALMGLAVFLVIRDDAAMWRKAEAEYALGREHRKTDELAYAWIAGHVAPGTVLLSWKDTVSYLYTGVPSSHDMFVAAIPQSEDVNYKPTWFLPQGEFNSGSLLLLESDFGEGFTFLLDGFRHTLESGGARLEYSAPGAFVYRVPLP